MNQYPIHFTIEPDHIVIPRGKKSVIHAVISLECGAGAAEIRLSTAARAGVRILAVLGEETGPLPAAELVLALPELAAGARHLWALRLEVDAPLALDRLTALGLELSYRLAGNPALIVVPRTLELILGDRASAMGLGALHLLLSLRAVDELGQARAMAERGQRVEAAKHLLEVARLIRSAPGVSDQDGSDLAERLRQLDEVRAALDPQPAVVAAAPDAVLINVRSRAVIPLGQQQLTVGRLATCDVVLSSSQVSRRHARLDAGADGHRIHCLGTTNGVFVNGEKVGVHRLRDGDRVTIGDMELLYEQRPAR